MAIAKSVNPAKAGLLALAATVFVQKPLFVLVSRVVDVPGPSMERNAAVRVLFHQAPGVINHRTVGQTDADILAVGQAHYGSFVHCSQAYHDARFRTPVSSML